MPGEMHGRFKRKIVTKAPSSHNIVRTEISMPHRTNRMMPVSNLICSFLVLLTQALDTYMPYHRNRDLSTKQIVLMVNTWKPQINVKKLLTCFIAYYKLIEFTDRGANLINSSSLT